jgi:hypothetical protein
MLFIANAAVLAWNLWLAGNAPVLTYAQRPPEVDREGVPFIKVNINPTSVPPAVNINPDGTVPRVEISPPPEIKLTPLGCENRSNFQTGITRSISGPLMLTYLSLTPPDQQATLVDEPGGTQRSVDLGGAGAQIATALYLASGQKLEFNSEILYSGCQPE